MDAIAHIEMKKTEKGKLLLEKYQMGQEDVK